MTKTKSTKHSLLLSALALLMCVSMLIGSTFAWFTDSVTSGNNKIVAGNLDVELEYHNGTGWKTVNNATDLFTGNLWEPGHTEVVYLRLSNPGSLALKYQLGININSETLGTNVAGETFQLSNYIYMGVVEGKQPSYADRETAVAAVAGNSGIISSGYTKSGAMTADAEDLYLAVVVYMPESVDNVANYKTGTAAPEINLGINLIASQLTYEKDSFDDQYDAMATIDTEEELLAALAADYDLIRLGVNITLTNSVEIPADKTVAIDLAGYTMSQVNAQQTSAYAMINNKGILTIEDSSGTGKISYTDTTPYTADPGWASNTIRNEGTLTVNGGTVENLTPEEVTNYGYPHAIDAYQGSVTTINGGVIKSLNYDCIRMFCNSETLATKVVINGGTIVNRVSFQDPQSTKPGYGILEINGGNFVTMNGVTANVRLLNFCNNCSNMKATVTGGTFDKGFKTQDYTNSGIKTSDWLNMGANIIPVTSVAELQTAIDNAVNGDVIKFAADLTGNVTVTQKANVKFTIDGNGKKLAGTITVDGKTATIMTAGLTVKNVNFVAATVDTAACINMGVDGNDNTRYICNLTVENCYFNVPGKVAVKSYSNGDKNLQIIGCTVAEGMHSLVQVNNVSGDTGLLVQNCKVYAKNGVNTVQSEKVSVIGSTFDVLGYAVRFGASSGGTGFAETYLIKDCDLKSACNESDDAVVILRGTADYATLTIENTTITGIRDIVNTATDATVNR